MSFPCTWYFKGAFFWEILFLGGEWALLIYILCGNVICYTCKQERLTQGICCLVKFNNQYYTKGQKSEGVEMQRWQEMGLSRTGLDMVGQVRRISKQVQCVRDTEMAEKHQRWVEDVWTGWELQNGVLAGQPEHDHHSRAMTLEVEQNIPESGAEHSSRWSRTF
ncbi:uncharacterized protein BJ212DRAFT_1590828 [Suillus subaureus]|uniref:Uncharacterized protein n=1 Tax=Suillus subaureus TaxID=48587 RepID=A0A9P7J6M5_9AGAM|nr:uncharacterized protein BJ212DRAFT_1590828 [Suillus subaureus]KAG1805474.1 hypothetical protein BJ212DRAFT_1590828 [Suillus subaureus]